MYRFITQSKSTPMDNQYFFCVEFFEGPDSFPGIDMAGSHKPAGFIGTQIDYSQIDMLLLSNLIKSIKIGGVTTDIDRKTTGGFDQIGAPQ